MRRAHSWGLFGVELSCILEALPSGLSAAGVGARGLMRRQSVLVVVNLPVPRREPLGAFTGLFRADYTQRTHAWNLQPARSRQQPRRPEGVISSTWAASGTLSVARGGSRRSRHP